MNIKSYEQILIAEKHILQRGYLSYEDLLHVVEYRPWIIRALTERLKLEPKDIKNLCADNNIHMYDYFKAVNQFLRSNLDNLPVGLFNGKVYVN